MAELVLLHMVVACLAPLLLNWMGRRAFLVLSLIPAASFVLLALQAPQVYSDAPPQQMIQWVPGLGMHFAFRLDPLSWVMSLIVTGVGALVLIYSAAYFSATAKALGRFAATFVAFAGAMLGLVTTDNTLLMYVFWELTTVFSYLLIGHYHERQSSRRAANQAILVTTMGGLAMLAGIVMLGTVNGGSYSFSSLMSSMVATEGSGIVSDAYLTTALMLLLVGAISKSALIPFHFWLPAAMAAPTPVSAYLHAAAMVKAGVYLVARISPGFAWVEPWQMTTTVLGLATMLIGGYLSLRQNDLKLVLAYGTVSQLGMMIAVLGHGTEAAALAGMALVVSHSLFKSCLFLTVGIIDWSTGTRDLRELSGLRRTMPLIATCAAIATASMAGIPPLIGFVAKEGALGAYVETGDWTQLVVFALGSALTVAYGLRFWFGGFGVKPDMEDVQPKLRSRLIVSSPVALTVATLALSAGFMFLDSALRPYASVFPGESVHLALWHGITIPLFVTVAVVVIGVLLYVARAAVERAQERMPSVISADRVYRRTLTSLEHFAADLTAVTQRGSLPVYLMIIGGVVIAGLGTGVVLSGALPGEWRGADWWGQYPIAVFVAITAFLAARARRRLKAVLLLSASGYGVALLFATHGAPDLAVTQVMVETVTLLLFVLVLRRLPTYFTNRPFSRDRWVRVGIATAMGVLVAIAGAIAVMGRVAEPVSEYYPDATLEYGYGYNIVNVTLVDTRAWDTMGEISVLLVAATGVASLLFLRDRAGMVDARRNRVQPGVKAQVWDDGYDILDRRLRGGEIKRPASSIRAPLRNRPWLAASSTLSARRRSVVFEVATRLVFHTMLIFSLYFLFAGHNQPGGGFAGGLMAGAALIVRYLAAGRYELGEAIRVTAGQLLGSGLIISLVAGILPVFFGGSVLQTVVFDFEMPVFGAVHLATALLFDIGVYVLVLGLVLDVLRSLGAEIDRHGELEGISDEETDDSDDDGEAAPAPSHTVSRGRAPSGRSGGGR